MKQDFGIFLILVLILGSFTGIFVPHSSNVFAQVSSEKFPAWVKNNFIWYGENKISEDDLLNVLQFLIDEKILIVSSASRHGEDTEISDDGFFSEIKEKIKDTIKIVQDDPILDAVAKAAIDEIPFVGGLLVNLYDNSKGTPEDRTSQVLILLKNYENMNEKRLKQEFEKLEENKQEIFKNRDYLEQLVSDTSLILQDTSELKDRHDKAEAERKTILEQQKVIMIALGIEPTLKLEKEINIPHEQLQKIEDQNKEIVRLNKLIEELTNEAPKIDIDYSLHLANTYAYAGEPQEAIKIYDKILEIEPHNPNALEGRKLVYTNQFLTEEIVEMDSRILLSQGTLKVHPGWTEPLDHIDDGSTITYSVWEGNTLEITYDLKDALPNESYYLSIYTFHGKDGESCISEFGKNLVKCKLKWGVWKTSFSFGPGPDAQLKTDSNGDGKKTIQIHDIAPGTYEMAFPLYYIIGENTPKTAYNTEENYGIGEKITFP